MKPTLETVRARIMYSSDARLAGGLSASIVCVCEQDFEWKFILINDYSLIVPISL